jgi:hypothetical protein
MYAAKKMEHGRRLKKCSHINSCILFVLTVFTLDLAYFSYFGKIE